MLKSHLLSVCDFWPLTFTVLVCVDRRSKLLHRKRQAPDTLCLPSDYSQFGVFFRWHAENILCGMHDETFQLNLSPDLKLTWKWHKTKPLHPSLRCGNKGTIFSIVTIHTGEKSYFQLKQRSKSHASFRKSLFISCTFMSWRIIIFLSW
jgi:hypothetical protein